MAHVHVSFILNPTDVHLKVFLHKQRIGDVKLNSSSSQLVHGAHHVSFAHLYLSTQHHVTGFVVESDNGRDLRGGRRTDADVHHFEGEFDRQR